MYLVLIECFKYKNTLQLNNCFAAKVFQGSKKEVVITKECSFDSSPYANEMNLKTYV